MDLSDRARQAAELFRYSKAWLDLPLVEEEFLLLQAREFASCDNHDHSLEHFRWAGFHQYFEEHDVLSDDEIDRYIDAHFMSPDPELGDNPLCKLAEHPGLTVAQRERLLQKQCFAARSLQRILTRNILWMKLEAEGLTAEIAEAIIATDDTEVQLTLLGHPDLKRAHLEVLVERGATKAIRNRSRQFLESRSFRK